MPRHDHYEELCALSVSGQLSVDDSKDLAEHVNKCAGCRDLVVDFRQIVVEAIPDIGVKRAPMKPPAGMMERFIARARSQGIPLTRKISEVGRRRLSWRAGLILKLAVICAFPAGLLYFKLFLPYVETNKKNIELSRPNGPAARVFEAIPADKSSKFEVADLQAKIASLNRAIEAEKRARQAVENDKSQLGATQVGLETENAALHRELADRTAQTEQIKNELDKLSSAKAADELVTRVDQAELTKLQGEVASLAEELNESKQLSAAANQAKELIVARNLHIVDVDDSDGSGRRLRPFGRIFYTEGKNLVFYAYDLSDTRKLNAKVNFYVWGSREGLNTPVRSLGIFHTDSVEEGRWVLRFDDANVLAKINCVFVTAESAKKNVTQPTGKQILFASLGSKPNHP